MKEIYNQWKQSIVKVFDIHTSMLHIAVDIDKLINIVFKRCKTQRVKRIQIIYAIITTTFQLGTVLIWASYFNQTVNMIIYLLIYFPLRLIGTSDHFEHFNQCFRWSMFAICSVPVGLAVLNPIGIPLVPITIYACITAYSMTKH
jgi:hypothetical protein